MLEKDLILQELAKIDNENSLKEFFDKYLDKKGLIPTEYKQLGSLAPDERKQKGQILSDLKIAVETEFAKKENTFKIKKINEQLNNEIVDITVDGVSKKVGFYTLLSQERRNIEEICQGMGFVVEYGRDMVTKYENFVSVNIPLTHPATEMHDTFYLEQQDKDGEPLVMRTQTSAMQNLLIKQYGVPMKIVVPGKVYRYENMDASHDTAFWQVEGMVIDEGISVADFKGMMEKLLSAVFKSNVVVRMRPSYFPFVEPGFEIDASCPICQGKGCSLCKQSGWIEILGAGMIHPNVLKEAGVDSEKYSGFAFGFGWTRMVAIKYGIKDIRFLTNGDLRFVESF